MNKHRWRSNQINQIYGSPMHWLCVRLSCVVIHFDFQNRWKILTLFALLSIATRNVYRSLLIVQQFPETKRIKKQEKSWAREILKDEKFVICKFLSINLNLFISRREWRAQRNRYDNGHLAKQNKNANDTFNHTICRIVAVNSIRWLPFLLTTSHSLHAHCARWILHFLHCLVPTVYRQFDALDVNLNKM